MDDTQTQPEAIEPKTKKREPAAPKTPPADVAPQELSHPAPQVRPQIRDRHDQSFRHDVFHAKPTKMKKNISWTHLQPEFVDIEHAHIFHSHDNRGRSVNQTQKMGGHFHYIEQYMDAYTGEIKANCGPAMREVTMLLSNGRSVTQIVPVFELKEHVTEGNVQNIKVVDDHRHEMQYLGSETLSGKIIKERLNEDKADAQAMGAIINPAAIKGTTPRPLTKDDGYTLE